MLSMIGHFVTTIRDVSMQNIHREVHICVYWTKQLILSGLTLSIMWGYYPELFNNGHSWMIRMNAHMKILIQKILIQLPEPVQPYGQEWSLGGSSQLPICFGPIYTTSHM